MRQHRSIPLYFRRVEEAGNKPLSDGITASGNHDDGDLRSRSLGRGNRAGPKNHNYIDVHAHKFGSQCRKVLEFSFSGPALENKVSAFDVTQFLEALHQRRPGWGSASESEEQNPDAIYLLRRRARNKRPCHRRAAEKRDELPPPHSITSSAPTDHGALYPNTQLRIPHFRLVSCPARS